MSISKLRLDELLKGQTSIAKKVYAAVPIAESWNIRKIMDELARNGGSQDHRTVLGCINKLIECGLVNEFITGEFRREPVKEVLTKSPVIEQVIVPSAKHDISAIKSQPLSPMDILGDLAARAEALASLAKALASDIGDAAIEVQQHIESSDADTQKFRQLQSLLKSIG